MSFPTCAWPCFGADIGLIFSNKFKALTADSACNTGDIACVDDKFAQCVGGKFVLQACGGGTMYVKLHRCLGACTNSIFLPSCAALPLVNSAGTSVTCTTAADRDARIAATGATAPADTGKGTAPADTGKGTGNKGGDNAANGNAAASSTAAAPAASSTAAAGDVQASTTLDPKAIQPNYASDGVVK